MRAPCSVAGCDRPSQARTYCKLHWKRWWKTGDPLGVLRAPPVPAFDRVMARTEREGNCLVFTGTATAGGYGQVGIGAGRRRGAHVVVAEAVHGPKPTPKHEVLHSCDNPPCVEPTHLRWGTHQENVHDAISRGRAVPPPHPTRPPTGDMS